MYFMSGQRCVRQDLIAKELDEECYGCKFRPLKLTSRFISWLFRHYRVTEYAIKFYDSEPEVPDDKWWDSAAGMARTWPIFQSYEEQRMRFNNWVDLCGPGIWGFTQREADLYARDIMRSVRGWPVPKKGRVFIGVSDSRAFIYAYGRDFLGEDYWWLLEKRDPKSTFRKEAAAETAATKDYERKPE